MSRRVEGRKNTCVWKMWEFLNSIFTLYAELSALERVTNVRKRRKEKLHARKNDAKSTA